MQINGFVGIRDLPGLGVKLAPDKIVRTLRSIHFEGGDPCDRFGRKWRISYVLLSVLLSAEPLCAL